MIQPLLIFGNWAILALRVVLGLILMRHGLPKLKSLKKTGGWFEGVGFRPGVFWALVGGIIEYVGGLAIVLGFLTQLAAVFIAFEFAIILVFFRKSRMFTKEAEIDWLILAMALAVATLGSGLLSLEGYWGLILF